MLPSRCSQPPCRNIAVSTDRNAFFSYGGGEATTQPACPVAGSHAGLAGRDLGRLVVADHLVGLGGVLVEERDLPALRGGGAAARHRGGDRAEQERDHVGEDQRVRDDRGAPDRVDVVDRQHHERAPAVRGSGRACRTGPPRRAARSPRRASASGSTSSTSGRTPVASQNASSRCSSAAGAHGRADDAQLQEEQPVEVGAGVGAGGGARDDEGAARAQRAHRVRPGGLADRLEHRVDLAGQPGAGLEGLRARRSPAPALALRLVPAGRPDPEAGRPAERDGGGRDAAAGALHEHPVARASGRSA